MASSLLVGCGRGVAFKILRLQAGSLQSLTSTVSLCTKPGDSEKSSAKDKREDVISSIPEEAVKLRDEDLKKFWANKTLVTFPQRAVFTPLETEPLSSSIGGSTENPNEESSSSSSSESDSSSDSDEEDNVTKDTLKTSVTFPRRSPTSSEQRTMEENTASEQFPQRRREGCVPEKLPCDPIITELPFKEKRIVFPRHDPISSGDGGVKVNATKQHFPQPQNGHAPPKLPHGPGILEPPAKETGGDQTTADKLLQSELVKSAAKQTSKETHLKGIGVEINPAGNQIAESQRPAANQLGTSLHEAASSKLSKGQQQSMTQSPTSLRQEDNVARRVLEAEAQERAAVEVQEEFVNVTAPAVGTTMDEEVTLETQSQAEEQSTAQEVEAATETAQEAIDTSTYKNLQHHEYTPFTFVDYDVELSKFRLPQPSSGRVSPRH